MSETPKIALVIGVNGGPGAGLAPLKFAEVTAERVARILAAPASGFKLYGGQPLLGAAATTDAVRQAIFDARREAGPDGMLLIYFIGHGRYGVSEQDLQDVYLVTSNFRPGDVRDDADAHLSMRWFQEIVLRHHAPQKLLLILDCCYAGAIGEGAPDPYIANLRERLARYLNIESTVGRPSDASMRKSLAAVSAALPAYEGDGTTWYSAALLRGWSGDAALSSGHVTYHSLFAYLQQILPETQTGDYGFDHSAGASLAYFPDRARLQTPNHQPWVMPHARNPDFVGREQELEQLALALTTDAPASIALMPAVAGLGGIGKSQLAIEFAHRYRDHFPGGVFWLSMEHGETVEAQIAACGGQRGLQLFDQQAEEPSIKMPEEFISTLQHEDRSTEVRLQQHGDRQRIRFTLREQAEQVMAIWEGAERRLLIFDNLEDPALLELWRPRGGGARVLVTTRRLTWQSGSGVRPIPLQGLFDEASRALLLGPRAAISGSDINVLIADPHEADAVQSIMVELGGLPLALTLAGGYLAERSISLQVYRDLLKRESIRHQSLNPELAEGLPSGHSASIIATFALSYERLTQSPIDQMARMIWQAAAQLAPEPILLDILLRIGDIDPENQDQRERGDQALSRLAELGLIERSGDTYRLHRLLSAYARSGTPDQDAARIYAARGLARTIEALDAQDRLENGTAPVREHVRHLAAQPLSIALDRATFLLAAGRVMYMDDDNNSAHQAFEEALTIFGQIYGRQHADVAQSLANLGRVALSNKDHPTAQQYYQEALAIREGLHGRQHTDVARSLSNLGAVARDMGDHTTAQQYYQEALAIREGLHGRQHTDVARSLSNLGGIARDMGDHTTAQQYYQEALAIHEGLHGRQHADVALCLSNLGAVARDTGDHTTAQQYYQEALTIYDKLHGRQHADVAWSLANIGRVMWKEQDYALAQQYYQESLGIYEMLYGRQHTSVAWALNILGGIALDAQDYPMARQRYEEALAIYEALYGRQHPNVAQVSVNLGDTAWAKKDYSTARQLYQEALTIHEKLHGRQHADVAQVLINLGGIAVKDKEYLTARQYYQEALTIREMLYERQHGDVAQVLFHLGRLALAENDLSTARKYYLEALEIFISLHGRQHIDVAWILGNLGGLACQDIEYLRDQQEIEEMFAVFNGLFWHLYVATAKLLSSVSGRAWDEQHYLLTRRRYQETITYYKELYGAAVTTGTTRIFAHRHAQECYQESLAIYEGLYGHQHTSVAWILHKLGGLAKTQQDYLLAQQYYQEVLTIYESLHGRQHATAAWDLEKLGELAHTEQDYLLAQQYYQEVLTIYESLHGRQHADVARVLVDIARVAWDENKYPLAWQYCQEALEIYENLHGRQHADVAWVLINLGGVLRDDRDYPSARKHYTEAHAIQENLLGYQDADTKRTRAMRRGIVVRVLQDSCIAASGIGALFLALSLPVIGAVAIVGVAALIGYSWWKRASQIILIVAQSSIGLFLALYFGFAFWRSGSLGIQGATILLCIGVIIGGIWHWLMQRPSTMQVRQRVNSWLRPFRRRIWRWLNEVDHHMRMLESRIELRLRTWVPWKR